MIILSWKNNTKLKTKMILICKKWYWVEKNITISEEIILSWKN